MDDVVAVRVTLASGVSRYFVTWGRVQDAVDPTDLQDLVLERCAGFSLGDVAVSAEVCASLQEASGEPYFFEALFSFSQLKIPYGDEYEKWWRETDGEMRRGKHLYFLGRG